MAAENMPGKQQKSKSKLSPRDEKFVDLVAKGKSHHEAYAKSGHKDTKNARTNAAQKLAKPHISAAVEARRLFYRTLADVEAKEIIGAYTEMAFASIEDAVNERGILDFKKAKQNGSAKLIKKITRQQTAHGENVSVEFYPRTDALDQLTEILGLKQKPRENEETIQKWQSAVAQLLDQGVVETRPDAVNLLKSVGFEGLTPAIEQVLITQTVQ